jgi:phosphate transport system protein
MTRARSLLDRDLAGLMDRTQQLSSMVLEALDRSMQALHTRDVQLARNVIDHDRDVNALRYQIEEECLRTLATQQPAASDLRLIIATTHIAVELERMGDHAASIADVVERMAEEDQILSLHKLPKMAKHANRMVKKSIDAFLLRDAEMALTVTRREEKIDKHYDALFHETLGEMQSEDYIQRATFLLWVGRHLERVGDRATNIAERVVFMVRGEFIELGE